MAGKVSRPTVAQIVVVSIAALIIGWATLPSLIRDIDDWLHPETGPVEVVTEAADPGEYDFPDYPLQEWDGCLGAEDELLAATESYGEIVQVEDSGDYGCEWSVEDRDCEGCTTGYELSMGGSSDSVENGRESYVDDADLVELADEFDGFEEGFCAKTLSESGTSVQGTLKCMSGFEDQVFTLRVHIYVPVDWPEPTDEAVDLVEQWLDDRAAEAVEVGAVVRDALRVD